jgi:hypothetical protein
MPKMMMAPKDFKAPLVFFYFLLNEKAREPSTSTDQASATI